VATFDPTWDARSNFQICSKRAMPEMSHQWQPLVVFSFLLQIRINVHDSCSRSPGMTHKPQKEAVAEHLVELRDQAVAALQRFKKIAERLDFYKQYLLLSENYDVRLAGPFIVIKGGQSAERRSTESDSAPKTSNAAG
jgi:hypothetical protein